MTRNIEIKACVADPAGLVQRVRALAATGPTPMSQDDTFYRCSSGRLKLRRFGDDRGELIAYERPDTPGPKTSRYRRVPVDDPQALHEALALSLGVVGRVRKQRQLYLLGRTRIHLDAVEGLGDFLEIEVVLAAGENEVAAHQEAELLLAALGVEPAACLAGAYVDLAGGAAAPGLPPA